MEGVFAKEPINSGRQVELDVTRGLAVFFMVLVHVQILFALESVQDSGLGLVVDFFGGIPAAPVFMFLLGIGINYTRKSEPRFLIRRGFGLLAIGYGLNLIRSIFPYLIKWWLTDWPGYLTLTWEGLIYVDILQFAGLALILFGLLKMTRRPYRTAALVGLSSVLLNFAALNIQTSNYVASALTGLFWGSSAVSYFPFLTWSIYPLGGFLFGALLIRCRDKRRFYVISLSAATLLVILLAVLAFAWDLDIGLSSDIGYYHHTLLGNLFFTAFVVGWLSLWYFLTPWLPPWLLRVLMRWSNHVTPIYFIHWVLIGIGLLAVEFNTLGGWGSAGVAIVIMVSSDGLATLYQRHLRRGQ
jgi:uncharacterized membrane protein